MHFLKYALLCTWTVQIVLLTSIIIIVLIAKRVLYVHSFKSYFSPPFNEYSYSNRLTDHVLPKKFNSLFLLRPRSQAGLTSVSAWVVFK